MHFIRRISRYHDQRFKRSVTTKRKLTLKRQFQVSWLIAELDALIRTAYLIIDLSVIERVFRAEGFANLSVIREIHSREGLFEGR